MDSVFIKTYNYCLQESVRPAESTTPETELPVASTSSSKLSKLNFVPTADKPVCGYARFFDDDKYDVLAVRDPKDIKVISPGKSLFFKAQIIYANPVIQVVRFLGLGVLRS